MAASFCGSNPSATVKQCSGKDNHDRLMALYHTGTDVKRHLLQYYLSQNKLDLAGFLYGKYQLLPSDYLKRAFPTQNFQLLDLGIYTIDALLSDQCFDLFWDSCLDKVKTSLENILSRHKKTLYSLYKISGRDNQYARNERKSNFLSKKQWEYLYNSPELQEMQENDFDLSLTIPNKGITPQSFDNDMNFVLLSNVCPLYQSLQVVTTNQMELSRIAVKHEINIDAFDEIWKLMATHLKQISSYCIGEAWCDHNLNWIKEGTVNGVKAQENRKCILESTFDNKTFLEDAKFMTRVQNELNLIEAEETKDLVIKLCDREIDVLLVKGQYEAGSYPSAIEKAARKILTSLKSFFSRQATDMKPVSTSKKINVVEEQKNIDRHSYLRFVCLIQDIAKNVLVEVFKKRLNGADVVNILNGMKRRLKPFLNRYQEEFLYPNGRTYAGDVFDMDVSLLYILLRNHGTICPHENGWGNDPEEDDNSIAANIDRIRIAKNVIVSHSSNCLLTYEEFKNRWAVIRQCCVELGGEEYEERIDNLSTSTFNSDLEQQFSEKLENIKETDMQSDRYYRKLEEILDTVKEIVVNLKKEQTFRERNDDTKHEEGCTPMIFQIKGNNIPGKNEIEEKIGNYKNNDMHVTSVESGSIIIRLQMSSSAFQSFEYVLTAIDKLLQQAFSSRPVTEDDIVVCIILSVDMHQFSEENTEQSIRKKKNSNQSTQGSVCPPKAFKLTDHISSTTDDSLLYGRSGFITKPEVSQQLDELVSTTGELPGNNTCLPFEPHLCQRSIDHNEEDKAKPTDLDNHKKRWLVVGICLHSVIYPALRKYVVPVLTVLYYELTRYQKIDTQTYSTYLKRYQPTNAYLNYEAVNNNKATFGNQKAKYDYKIRNVVDLSKLFLQTHTAHYTGFDETCDSSALFGIISSIDKFPTMVKSDAEEVRRNIRNPWAHCDFNEWDAVKYADSFQLIEKLIRHLSLSSTEEHHIIGEKKKWEINGQQFLSGTTLDYEFVNDIRQQTHVLAENTKLVADEAFHKSMRIQHVFSGNEQTKPTYLDKYQKRWLVVGICLHSVISPALRTYIVPILTVLYNEFTLKHKIDTQIYPTYLKRYQPTNAYLNYEAVNNNKAKYGNQKAKYDYTIKNVVDLSKLFLQTHTAHYTGFDETCDSSALFGIISSIDMFPTVVKSDAEEVRRHIRNPWACCDFTEWDAVKYADSFQMMEKLIKDLSLSSFEEHKIIGKMKKWEINGQQFLSGATLDYESVNEIRQQTHVLAENTKLVADEEYHKSMRIKNVLENFDIRNLVREKHEGRIFGNEQKAVG